MFSAMKKYAANHKDDRHREGKAGEHSEKPEKKNMAVANVKPGKSKQRFPSRRRKKG